MCVCIYNSQQQVIIIVHGAAVRMHQMHEIINMLCAWFMHRTKNKTNTGTTVNVNSIRTINIWITYHMLDHFVDSTAGHCCFDVSLSRSLHVYIRHLDAITIGLNPILQTTTHRSSCGCAGRTTCQPTVQSNGHSFGFIYFTIWRRCNATN